MTTATAITPEMVLDRVNEATGLRLRKGSQTLPVVARFMETRAATDLLAWAPHAAAFEQALAALAQPEKPAPLPAENGAGFVAAHPAGPLPRIKRRRLRGDELRAWLRRIKRAYARDTGSRLDDDGHRALVQKDDPDRLRLGDGYYYRNQANPERVARILEAYSDHIGVPVEIRADEDNIDYRWNRKKDHGTAWLRFVVYEVL